MKETSKSYRIKYYFGGFKALAKGYWTSAQSKHKGKAYGLLGMVIAMNLASVYLTVLINNWYKEFWDVLQAYQFESFWPLVGKFTLMAMIYISLGVYSVYLQQMIQIKWRQWMTDKYLVDWMKGRVYYKLKLSGNDMDNPDQRISEDINQFVTLTLSLTIGMVRQLISLVAFVIILWNLSGILTVPVGSHEYTIYGYMVWLSLIYSAIGTFLTHKVGKKLIHLNYEQQRYEADFRFSMMRVRENSESIAFYRGEAPEVENFQQRFIRVVNNFRYIMNRQKLLNAFTVGYSQLAIIIPLLLASPRWFAMEVQVGWIMQLANAFDKVQSAMSYFVSSYTDIAQWCSVIQRLYGFDTHMKASQQLHSQINFVYGENVGINNLSVSLPKEAVAENYNGDGGILVKDCTIDMKDKHSLIIMGSSGVGKSTVLRAMAGLWPYADGTVMLPKDNREYLFLPQKPYLPLGSLRESIFYPLVQDKSKDEELKRILSECRLNKFISRLDDVDDWSRILSLGEQQRLAFARILLYKPKFVFLDEATSALDEDLESYMYDLLKRDLLQTKIISIGHRSTLLSKHEYKLTLIAQGEWSLAKI